MNRIFRLILIAVLLLSGLGSVAILRPELLPEDVQKILPAHFSANIQNNIAELQKSISTPDPLRGPLEGPAVTLTQQGVFMETNAHRAVDGKPALTRSATLDKAAANKVADMFEQQYFDHVSPNGKGPSDVVDGVGYQYITVGENLALGNFASDAALVEAWMNSPGHRANILSTSFTELGVAVGKGVFEGRNTWLAVQTFGTPLTACPTPATTLKSSVDTLAASIHTLSNNLKERLIEIQSLFAQGEQKIKEGNQKIEEGNTVYRRTKSKEEAQPYWDEGEDLQAEGNEIIQKAQQQQAEYNEQVTLLNTKQEELSKISASYNAQVQTYNACVQKFE